jgi:hypothetical protein
MLLVFLILFDNSKIHFAARSRILACKIKDRKLNSAIFVATELWREMCNYTNS